MRRAFKRGQDERVERAKSIGELTQVPQPNPLFGPPINIFLNNGLCTSFKFSFYTHNLKVNSHLFPSEMKTMNIQVRSEQVELAGRHLLASISCQQGNTENKSRLMRALAVARSVV